MVGARMDINKAKHDSNFTILAPGGCQSKCKFCFWNRNEAGIITPDDYFERLISVLFNLPEQFQTISISGGEPSESYYLEGIVKMVDRVRRERFFRRIVLTTNLSDIDAVKRVLYGIDHINISRHRIDDASNDNVFGRKSATTKELSEFCSFNNYMPIQIMPKKTVTMNVVYDEMHESEAFDYIEYAETAGFGAISFRKKVNRGCDVSRTYLEHYFYMNHHLLSEDACPVCRGSVFEISNGMQVRFKAGVSEPSIEMGEVFEAVFHPDGNLYADWSRMVPLYLDINKTRPERSEPTCVYQKPVFVAGCGRSGIGGC